MKRPFWPLMADDTANTVDKKGKKRACPAWAAAEPRRQRQSAGPQKRGSGEETIGDSNQGRGGQKHVFRENIVSDLIRNRASGFSLATRFCGSPTSTACSAATAGANQRRSRRLVALERSEAPPQSLEPVRLGTPDRVHCRPCPRSGPMLPLQTLVGVACVSAALLMTELALTRIFSVVMYYHFAFLAISVALFGLSASGVFAFVRRQQLERLASGPLLASRSLVFSACTIVALFVLVRLRVGLNYSAGNLALMLAIYTLAAVPFFTGGLVVTLAISRMSSRVNAVYAADLLGAAAGCLVLLPLLDRVGAPGVVLGASALAVAAAILFVPRPGRARTAIAGRRHSGVPLIGQVSGIGRFDVTDTKGHQGDRVLFSKWNSFSRIGVYERAHGDWSLSPAYTGPLPDTRFMDIDSAASTPILRRLAGSVERPVSSLRAHGARVSDSGSGLGARGSRGWGLGDRGWGLGARGAGGLRRSSSGLGGDATWSRRWCSARGTSTGWRSIRSSPTTSWVTGFETIRAASTAIPTSTSSSTTDAASSVGARNGTTSSRRRWWTRGPRPPPGPTRSPRTPCIPSRRSTTISIT